MRDLSVFTHEVFCSVDLCNKEIVARGFCGKHYSRFMKHGDPTIVKRVPKGPELCSTEGCGKEFYGRGRCKTHYSTFVRSQTPDSLGLPGCSVTGCLRTHYAKSYCRKHWERWKRNGDPLNVQHVVGLPVAKRLAKKSKRVGACIEWQGHRNKNGYGSICINRRTVSTHRAAYEDTHGPIPDELVVRHKCDNPPCIRVDHLELGTHADNSRDKVVRGRSTFGSRNGSARLTEGQVCLIYEGHLAGRSRASLALEFGCGKSTISRIIKRDSWQRLLNDRFPKGEHESAA